ncbi:ribosome assembly cofactor RimP [Psychroflexus sp. YR1-1]|uniref:Ribosome maturation factor RimP n=1 Tax=Psychroflexus aurantiacus TaxID=2709310 RepID=A0A6B3R2X9_9FLAO|nr:ribosome assembly cofactor RimP [Psychroflexus aurantiacus]NEV94873.1 ribosome assembly cofactor RimP [Psychroflexus aurantiacus]
MALEKEQIMTLVTEGLEEDKGLFLIDLQITGGNNIKVIIDGDRDLSISDCVNISRAIEHNLDREIEDFALEVASCGATEPLTYPRQYQKNVGRKLAVVTKEEKIEADLVGVEDGKIHLKWTAKEPKPVGKGKHKVQKETKIAFEDIVKAQVIINFNK